MNAFSVEIKTTVALIVSLLLVIFAFGTESNEIEVTLEDWVDGDLVWIGVKVTNSAPDEVQWFQVTEQEFRINIPGSVQHSSLIILKKNHIPIKRRLDYDIINRGLKIEFERGGELHGRISEYEELTPILDGNVSIECEQKLESILPDPDWFRQEISSEGTYQITGIPFGKCTVSVTASGYISSTKIIEVTENLDQELDFLLTRASYLRGTIVDAYGNTIEGILEITDLSEESDRSVFQTHTQDRNFQVGPFPEGTLVEITARLNDGRRSRPVEIITPKDSVVLHVHNWVQLHGYVRSAKTGKAVEELLLTIKAQGRRSQYVVHKAPNGKFDIEVEDTASTLIIEADGFLLWNSGILNFEGLDSFDFGVIELDSMQEIRGKVVDRETLEPIQAATLRRLELQDTHSTRWYYNNVTTVTDDKGEFTLKGFPNEGGLLQVVAKGYQVVRYTIQDVNADILIELPLSGSISGQVLSLNGTPTSAMILLESVMSGVSKLTEDGNFHFATSDGTYTLSARNEYGSTRKKEVTVKNGESVTDVQLVVDIVGRVYGTVQGLAQGETVTIKVGGKSQPSTYVTSNGDFELLGLAIGEHVIKSTTSLNRHFQDFVLIDETLESRIELDFSGDSSLSGIVLAGNHPLAAVEILVNSDDTSLPQSKVLSSRDGTYYFEGLSEGIYRLEIISHGYSEEVSVVGDTTLNVMLSSISLAGYINAPESVAGSEVQLNSNDNDRKVSMNTKVDAGGFYHFQGIPSGNYTLIVSHPDYQEATRYITLDKEVFDFDVYLQKEEDAYD